jgi:hypothetical protein
LLRKVCNNCHLINDGKSDFCQSCGSALAAVPSAPPGRTVPPREGRELTDVAYLEPDEQRHLVSAPAQFQSGPIVVAPSRMPALHNETLHGVSKVPTSAYRTPILLGVGGAAAMLFAALLWPRIEFPSAPPEAAPARGPSSIPAGQGTVSVNATPRLTEGAVPSAGPASASSDASQHEAAGAPWPTMSSDASQLDKGLPRRTPADWILAAHPPASSLAKKPTPASERARVPPLQPWPRRPVPPECTPQVDALSLCEPGARVTGR